MRDFFLFPILGKLCFNSRKSSWRHDLYSSSDVSLHELGSKRLCSLAHIILAFYSGGKSSSAGNMLKPKGESSPQADIIQIATIISNHSLLHKHQLSYNFYVEFAYFSRFIKFETTPKKSHFTTCERSDEGKMDQN